MADAPRLTGYLPDDTPPLGKLIAFALQQVIVMFPATVLVAILTKFDISVTIVASGLATLGFLLITGRKIPLYYGSSFSYIAAVAGVVATVEAGALASGAGAAAARELGVRAAQCGIVASGLVSIAAGWLVRVSGRRVINRVLPPVITGSVAIIIGLSLAKAALDMAAGGWTIALVTLLATILFSVYLRGTLGQLPVLFGVLVGYVFALSLGKVDFAPLVQASFFAVPHFTFPVWSSVAVWSIMPIAIATIPESTAHLYQIDLYVNNLARRLGRKNYEIANRLGDNLIGDGAGDMIAGFIGGPAGTNYGENNSLMAITRNFSVPVLMTAALIAIALGFLGKLAGAVSTIPTAVVGGVSIYLFGVIGVQGVALMIAEKVDLFSPRTLAVASTILVIGLGGSVFPNGMIPLGPWKLPAIATAAVFGILLNLFFELFPARPDAAE
ncbi:MAG: solute carrier family 23 protein [Bacillota bacterium]|nr:solute carrier family 23 protein [Bacillota bacterium]